ncbi:MAG TPA: Gfo/Idh/MocA family oxidoreductase, partial [Candidatus Udaeobacter sp.]|nr:Gfo/Idh/MocA family oxidoreductase [Candidatus Udaeobacter sp.]
MTDRISVRVVLDAGEHDYPRLARPLVESFDAKRFDLGGPDPRVVLAASDRAIEPDEALRLKEFVHAGGGLVMLHGTLAAWSSSAAIREVAGWVPGGRSRSTELIVKAAPGHGLTRGLEAEWAVPDEIFLSEGPPVDAHVVLRTTWQFTDQVVAYERRYGDGRFLYLGLGNEPSTYADPTFQRLVARMLMFAAGKPVAEPIGVGLIGYGAIARDHAAAIAAIPGLKLAAICDLSEQRRDAAAREWSTRTYAGPDQLLGDPDVGLVIVGTPPVAHADSVLASLASGRHVVCEKPFALRVEDADRMIDAAAARGLALTVYQSRRWDPDYLAVRSAVRSGRVGEPFYMESFIGGYGHPCDFWHSHEPISGGMIFDWGSHYFDWMLQLFEGRV